MYMHLDLNINEVITTKYKLSTRPIQKTQKWSQGLQDTSLTNLKFN